MALRTCAKNHTYDDEKYSSCPFCNPNQTFIELGADTPIGNAGHTTAPGMNNPVVGGGSMGGGMGSFQPPQVPVNNWGVTMAPGAADFSDISQNAPQHTVGPMNFVNGGDVKVTDANHTKGVITLQNGTEPVVGWLVGLNGEISGQDYKLIAGVNSIGRGAGNSISIEKGHKSMKREKHAVITYDPRGNCFFITPESGLVYVNDQIVHNYADLKIYDKISLSEQNFLFMPLCSEQFHWNCDGLGEE